VLHKVFNSHFFLGSQRMPNFALFTGLENAEISQKHLESICDYSHSMVPMDMDHSFKIEAVVHIFIYDCFLSFKRR